jgi:uncharacterized membrane protein YgcG
MKNYIIATLLFLAAGSVAPAQDDPAVLARLAAQHARENGGGDAAPAPDTATAATAGAQDNGADTNAAVGAIAGVTNAADAAATGTNAAADPDEIARQARLAAAAKEAMSATKLPGSLASLQIITQKNIFNPSRLPWSPNRLPPRQAIVENFYFRGASEKINMGFVAIFEGDGVPNFPPTRCIGDSVNGFKIKAITRTNVTLTDPKSTNIADIVFTLPGMGGQQGLTRSDGGPWKPAYYTPSYDNFAPRPQRADIAMGGPNQFTAPAMPMMMPPNQGFTFPDPSQDPSQGYGNNPRNNRRGGTGNGRGGGRGGGGNGGFGGGAAGGFGGGGNNGAFAPPSPPPDPNAPIDPAVLARLRAARAQE